MYHPSAYERSLEVSFIQRQHKPVTHRYAIGACDDRLTPLQQRLPDLWHQPVVRPVKTERRLILISRGSCTQGVAQSPACRIVCSPSGLLLRCATRVLNASIVPSVSILVDETRIETDGDTGQLAIVNDPYKSYKSSHFAT